MIKTLLGNIKEPQTADVLNMVRVADGMATTTDCDHEVSINLDVADGMYHKYGFAEGYRYKSDIPASDFPSMKFESEPLNKITLDADAIAALRWIAVAASEETRYYLNGVYFDKDEMVATDGHRLHGWRHGCGIKTGEILLNKAVELILSMVDETGAQTVDLAFFKDRYIASIGTATIKGKLIDATYPPWKNIIPKHENRTIFDPEEIRIILPEIKVLEKISRIRGRALAVGGGRAEIHKLDDALKSQCAGWPVSMDFGEGRRIGFNPHYLADLCPGEMSFGGAEDPLLIEDGERFAVIMPMKLS